ncbi:chain length determinant protein EpsF [Aquincola sp. MAHUQ-54]|uniref:Chain length determinant protein EpsF n=1 Tax=Aquincola agrisoli TaxID=3119538 RepID=A0AAW9QLL7_9BURK
MTFGQFLSILRARKWAALLVFLLVVGTTVGVSLVLPKQYDATASVVIDIKPDPISVIAFQGMAMPSFMATQADILVSDRVALRVIRDLRLLESPQLREQWQTEGDGEGTFEQWLITLLHKKLDVKPSRESNVININYRSPDPRFSAGLANAFAQAYIATTLELRVDPAKQFSAFFVAQSKEARSALEEAQAKLSAYQREKGIIAADERLDVENARLAELSSQLVQIQAISGESSSRQAQAQGASGDRLQEVLSNPLIGGLRADLTRNEAKLQELNSKLGDNHPQVVEAKANITELRARIDAEIRRVTGGVTVTNTINKQREAQVRGELEAQRAKLLEMKAVRDQGQVLVREVENAQRAYDGVMQRLNQTAMESQTNQSYANLLTTAQPPAEHASPKMVLNTALAVFLGALLALGVVLLLELSDRRVRKPEDVIASLGLPVLGVLPTPNAKRFMSGKHSLMLQHRAMGLPAPQANKGA